jgi:hypothetical protein
VSAGGTENGRAAAGSRSRAVRSDGGRALTRLAVEGFKSIGRRQEIEIRPLTILAGANSSGKSSMVQPLLLLKQTLESSSDQGALALDGPNAPFTAAEQLISRSWADEGGPRFEISVGGVGSLFIRYDRAARGVFRPLESRLRGVDIPLVGSAQGRLGAILRVPVEIPSAKHRDPVFLGAAWDLFEAPLAAIIHVPGLRGLPQRLSPRRVVSGVDNHFRGRFEDYTASVIAAWQERRDRALGVLGTQLRELGLTAAVRAERVLDTAIDVRVARRAHGSADDEWFSLADVGIGVSQVLPVLVSLLVARAGQLVFLEQPELHLHPRAQVALAPILARAARRGVRVMVETHSSLLILALQTLVAAGDLAPAHVVLHWFRRDPRSWETRVTSAELDDAGAFGEWPEDFDEVEMGAQQRYLDAVTERRRAATR